uniref:SH2 domain-containing protein n=1 Tax=Panagrolaimus sp. ES5 TaxID=591445 RepID=A0AC34G3L7_9BILA
MNKERTNVKSDRIRKKQRERSARGQNESELLKKQQKKRDIHYDELDPSKEFLKSESESLHKQPKTSPLYQNLHEVSFEEDSKRSPSEAHKKERYREAHRRSSTTKEQSKSQKKKKIDKTVPVYMPRSKYYRDTDDVTLRSARSHCHCHKNEVRKYSDNNLREEVKEYPRAIKTHSPFASSLRTLLDDDNDMFYIGAKTASQAAKLLKQNDFRIYYQVPEKSENIPYKLGLFLAYMSSQDKEVFHIPIDYGKNSSGEKVWSLRYIDSTTFATLQALIEYHKTYAYIDPSTGRIDTFPVWKNAIIDDDYFNEC